MNIQEWRNPLFFYGEKGGKTPSLDPSGSNLSVLSRSKQSILSNQFIKLSFFKKKKRPAEKGNPNGIRICKGTHSNFLIYFT